MLGGRPSHAPLEARAWLDEELIASSVAALRVDAGGSPPMLCFPSRDVRMLAAPDLCRPAPDGYVSFDTANPRVRVMVVDRYPGDREDQYNLLRFPYWGDATDLIAMLDVAPVDRDTYASVVRSAAANPHRDVVEASQMLGQALVAARRRHPERRVVMASMVFTKVANTSQPLRVHLEQHSHGRSFTALGARIMQQDKLCAVGTLLLDTTAPDVMRHAESAGSLSDPRAAVFYDLAMTGRDIRYVDDSYSNDPDAPLGPPEIDAWLRFRGVPRDGPLHEALLASYTGFVAVAAAMRPHAGIGQNQAHRTLSTAINAITISFHAEVRADAWMLVKHRSTFAGDGMTHSTNRVYDQQGKLLASFSVEAMVRAMPPARAVDAKTAL